jgi:predicted dehydrogenase
MQKVRLGIIGMGNSGRYHAGYLLNGKVDRCELVAVCSPNAAALEGYKPLKIFTDADRLIESSEVDAVLIATPHVQHAPLGIAAMSAGVHVMVEKPIASHKADGERLIAAHHRCPHVVFGAMFQLRIEPRYQRIRQLLHDGALGDPVRVTWINTDWYRTEAYYASGGWRATWKGEGGGVLLNQCLHNLDTLQWLLGMPSRVRGFCKLGRFHQIEVEDDVTTYLEWPSGATGTFISSTGEAPGTNRLEITGARGRLVLENDKLTLTRNVVDMAEFGRSAEQGFVKPESWTVDVPFENATLPHATIMQSFVGAILDGRPLLVPGEAGLGSVELANAMVYSSLLGRVVELPMDGLAWERKLSELIANSTVQKRVAKVSADDFASSFRK